MPCMLQMLITQLFSHVGSQNKPYLKLSVVLIRVTKLFTETRTWLLENKFSRAKTCYICDIVLEFHSVSPIIFMSITACMQDNHAHPVAPNLKEEKKTISDTVLRQKLLIVT